MFIKASSSLKKLMSYDQLELNLSKYKLSKFVHAFLRECNYETSVLMAEDVDSEKKEDGPRVDIPTFADIKLIDRAKSVEIDMKRCCGGIISEKEKWELEKFKFVELFTDGKPSNWNEFNMDQDLWSMYYHTKRARLYNIRLEKQVNTNSKAMHSAYMTCFDKNSLAVMSSRTPYRVDKMREIMTDLGIDMTQKVGAQISKERLDNWCSKAILEYADIQKTFNIRDFGKRRDVTTAGDCITLLNSIFKEYGYTQIKQVRKELPRDANGKRSRDLNAPYVIEDNSAFHKSNELAPQAGQRIYDSMSVTGNQRRLLGS